MGGSGVAIVGDVFGGFPPKRDAKGIARRGDCAVGVGRGGKGGLVGRTCSGREVLCAGTAYGGYPESNGIGGSGARDEEEMSANLVCESEEYKVKCSLWL